MYKFIKPLGIIAYCLLWATLLSGLLRLKVSYHKILAIISLIIASLHLILVLVF